MKLKEGIEIDPECTITESIIINFNAILTPPFVINQKVTKTRESSQITHITRQSSQNLVTTMSN